MMCIVLSCWKLWVRWYGRWLNALTIPSVTFFGWKPSTEVADFSWGESLPESQTVKYLTSYKCPLLQRHTRRGPSNYKHHHSNRHKDIDHFTHGCSSCTQFDFLSRDRIARVCYNQVLTQGRLKSRNIRWGTRSKEQVEVKAGPVQGQTIPLPWRSTTRGKPCSKMTDLATHFPILDFWEQIRLQ